jgi:hypothetical protein
LRPNPQGSGAFWLLVRSDCWATVTLQKLGSRNPIANRRGFPPSLVVRPKKPFETGWVTDAGYLRARRQNIVDILTSKATLPRALDLANELFSCSSDAGTE